MATAKTPLIPVIDTHIHLFDVSRPQGVPWPPKNDAVLYKTALPERYRKLATQFGIVGAIEVGNVKRSKSGNFTPRMDIVRSALAAR